MSTTRRKNKSYKNTTIKNCPKKCRPNDKELKIYCKQFPSTFNSFEEEYEKTFAPKFDKHHKDIEKELIKLFKTPFTPSKYTAQDDYYTYINYQWISQKAEEFKKERKYYVQIDSFRVTQEKVYYELMDIVKEFIKNNNSRQAKAIKTVYQSLYRLDNRKAEDFVKYYVKVIDNRIATGNIYELLGSQNKNEIISWGCPIVWSVLKDEKNVKYYRSTISAPQLTIYDYNIYIEDKQDDQDTKEYKKLFKKKYLEFITTMFEVCLGKNNGFKATDVWDCEYEMLSALGCDSIKDDDLDGYNELTQEKALKLGFNWNEFASQIGYKNPPKKFICTSTNYLKCIMETLTKDNAWKSLKWKTYFLYICFRQVMRFHSEWRLIYYEFHGKFVKGIPSPYPKELYPIFGLSLCFNTFLTNEYIERNKKDEYIEYTKNMGKDLLAVYKRIIKNNTWLSPSTKKYALLKLENIKLEIGSPKILREDPILDYSSTDAYQNMRRIAYWRTKRMIKLDGQSSEVDIPIIDWEEFKMVGKQSYIVNAYYTPTENSIYVPLAYLQKPFIDLEERGIEYNLAHIGYTLGHEMSHCLDDLGSKYDENGNLHNWWTENDRKKFNAKVNNVIKQYETFAAYDGIKMDASLSTGENLADISGLAICENYLKDFQDKNKDIVPIRALSFSAFFVYIAIQARQKIFDEAIKAQLKTNPHPMDKYRTNCPLARLELFRSLNNIKKGDKMYWPSADTIW
jgi:predicted metalloendopeptidase